MPLPLIPILVGGAALAAAGFGAKKGYDGYKNIKETAKIHEDSKDLYNEAHEFLEEKKRYAEIEFEKLGEIKAQMTQTTLDEYSKLIEKIDIEYKEIFIDMKQEDITHLKEVKNSIIELKQTLGGLVASAGSGALAGFGAYGGAGLLATASTGTAISSLSGVAATNATLAWFGGGSLAAGGLGMAGGTAVLGGVVAAPVILVAGLVFANATEKKKYDAMAYYDTVEALAEAMKLEALLWGQVKNKSNEIINTLINLDSQLKPLIQEIKSIIKKRSSFLARLFGNWNKKGSRGYKVSRWSEDEQKQLQILMQNAEVLANVINAPVLSDEDKLTQDIINLQKQCKGIMDEINEKWGEE